MLYLKSEEECRFLKAQVARYELITDACINREVRKCQEDDTYFVFEEIIRDVLLLWGRDEWIKSKISADASTNNAIVSKSDYLCQQKIHMKGKVNLYIEENLK